MSQKVLGSPATSQKTKTAFCDRKTGAYACQNNDIERYIFCDTAFYTQGMPKMQQSPAESLKLLNLGK
jgi:hypothetical protein